MIITFCGHSDFIWTKEYEEKIFELFDKIIGNSAAELYFGGYGGFDSFVFECGRKYKQTHPCITLVFITPYILNNTEKVSVYDSVIYPSLENVPPRYAISRRNQWMAEKADFVIAYVTHSWGGAYQTYKHAMRKCKRIFNIAKDEENK